MQRCGCQHAGSRQPKGDPPGGDGDAGITSSADPRGRFAPAAIILVLSSIVYPLPAGVAVEGLILGLVGAMIAVGMALIYRSNRILNFAQGELGTAPTVLVVCLVGLRRVELLPGPVNRPGRRPAPGCARRAGHHPALLPLAPTDPDRGHPGPGRAALAGCGVHPVDLGQAPGHQPDPLPSHLPLHDRADRLLGRSPDRSDPGAAGVGGRGRPASLHEHRRGHPGQCRERGPGQSAGRPGQAAPDRDLVDRRVCCRSWGCSCRRASRASPSSPR